MAAGRGGSRPRLPLPQRVDRRVAEADDGHGGGAPRVLRHVERLPLSPPGTRPSPPGRDAHTAGVASDPAARAAPDRRI